MPCSVLSTDLPDVLVLQPQVFEDDRGYFFESFNLRDFRVATGLEPCFVQDNHSQSEQGVLRGLHYQVRQPQGKLVRVIQGVVFDVVVDLRRSSPTFGKWAGVELSASNRRQLWIPPGFAHGFLVLSEVAQCLYKTTEYWRPDLERCLRWNDPHIGIQWPLLGPPRMSARDAAGLYLSDAERFD